MSNYVSEVGECHIGIGCMFSGKSTWLKRNVTTLSDLGFDALIINHINDTRKTTNNTKGLTTHHGSGGHISDKIDTVKTTRLSKLNVEEYQVIGIDEAQFFPDLVENVRKWVNKHNIIVYVAGLASDSDMNSFGQIKELLCFCDTITKHQAKCMKCMLIEKSPYNRINLVPAPFTMVKEGNTKSGQTQVGGSEIYIAVCRKCHKSSK